MSEARNKTQRFLAEHPVCCFCGTVEASTIDHVPSRECFRDRVGPEGFEFPACRACNAAPSQLEQVVALYLMLADHSGIEPSERQMRRLATGVANNNRAFMPAIKRDARLARQFFAQKSLQLPVGQAYGETPIMQLPAAHKQAFEVFGRRLACALYYKEVGRPVPPDNLLCAGWVSVIDPMASDFAEKANSFLPMVELPNRRNTDIGNQFAYLWGARDDHDIFSYAAQFTSSYIFFGAVTASDHNVPMHKAWRAHSTDIPWKNSCE